MDMAEQNAKLVAAYVEKKREVKQLQVGVSSSITATAAAATIKHTTLCEATLQQGSQQQAVLCAVVVPRILHPNLHAAAKRMLCPAGRCKGRQAPLAAAPAAHGT
jgi:hypothetical protein